MTVRELNEILSSLSDDTEVCVAVDPEGNGFSRLSSDYSFANVSGETINTSVSAGNSVVLWPSHHLWEVNT